MIVSGDRIISMPETLWRIESGVVRAIAYTPEGNSTLISYFGRNDLVGGGLPFAILESVVPAQLSPSPDRVVSIRQAREMQSLLWIVQQRAVVDRLRLLLGWLADKFGEGSEIPFILTHQELADSIAASRVTITRTLKEMRLHDEIECCNRKIYIKKPQLLPCNWG